MKREEQFRGPPVSVPDGSGWRQLNHERVAHYRSHRNRGTPDGALVPLCGRPSTGACGRMDVTQMFWAPIAREPRDGDCEECTRRYLRGAR